MQLIEKVNLFGKLLILGGLSYYGFLYLQSLPINVEKLCILINNSATLGGFLSGSLHALTGPDHMAILLPLIFNKHWYSSCIYGIVWGCGHGVTSTVIGVISYIMKSYVVDLNGFFNHYRHVMNAVVGLTLIVIGGMGMYETSNSEETKKDDPIADDCNYRRKDDDIEKQKELVCRNEDSYFLSSVDETSETSSKPLELPSADRKNLSLHDPNALEKHLELSNIRNIFLGNEMDSPPPKSVLSGSASARALTPSSSASATPLLSKAAFQDPNALLPQQQQQQQQYLRQQRSTPSFLAFAAIFVNGCVLGLSWDGLPSLAPSIMLNHHKPLLLFLGAYLVGTASMMGIAAGAVGEATCFISSITGSGGGGGKRTNRRLSFSSASNLNPPASGHSSTHSISSGAGTGAEVEPDGGEGGGSNISERLAYMSSLTSCLIGAFWVLLAGFKYFTDTAEGAVADGLVGALANDHALRAEIENNDYYVLQLHNHNALHHHHSHHHHDDHHSHSELLLSGGSISIIVAVIFYTIYKEYRLHHYYKLRRSSSSSGGSLSEDVEEDKGYSIINGRETSKADVTLCHVLCQWGCNCMYPLIKLFRGVFDKQKR